MATTHAAPRRLATGIVVLIAAAFVLPLWVGKYPPFVDLPQHAAQLSIWQHLDDPSFGFAGRYVLNWHTPYLLVYLVALPFVWLTSPLVALKIVVSLGVLALPLSLWLVLRGEGVDSAYALLGFPLAYGFSLSWGFLNCALASAPALVLLALVRRPRHSLWLALVGVVLFYTHALVFAFAIGLAVLIALDRGPRALVQLWPLAIPFALAVVWYATASSVAQANGPMVWAWSWNRVLWFASLQLGHPRDVAALIAGVVLLALPFVGNTPSRRLARWLPFGATIVAVLLAPHFAFGTAYLFGRFSVFLVPTLLYALDPKPNQLTRMLIVVVCLAWAGLTVFRFVAFGEEARAWDTIEAMMAPNQDVRAIVTWRSSAKLPGAAPVYEHFPLYYQADKGGLAGFSFAENFLSFARYANPADARVTARMQVHPESFDVRSEPAYHYYVVRSPTDVGASLFGGVARLVVESGGWWLYERPSASQR